MDSDAVPENITNYVLLNTLVNLLGKVNGWYPMDQYFEFINLNICNGLTDYHLSYNKGEWIKNNVLNILFMREL
jgi:hypothetical protein